MALLLALAPTALANTEWYVNGVSGNNSNNCISSQTACKTIGHAIPLASSGDSVMVAAATYRENLTIGISLNVIGSGAGTTFIDGGAAGTVVAIPIAGTKVTLSNLTISNGKASAGGGVSNNGMLTINNCIISGNRAKGQYGSFGGGISNTGTLKINNSTISRNFSGPGFSAGGGIYSMGTLTINNSTVAGNGAPLGGGLFNQFQGIVSISNSTFSGNSGYQGAARRLGPSTGLAVDGMRRRVRLGTRRINQRGSLARCTPRRYARCLYMCRAQPSSGGSEFRLVMQGASAKATSHIHGTGRRWRNWRDWSANSAISRLKPPFRNPLDPIQKRENSRPTGSTYRLTLAFGIQSRTGCL